MIFRAWALGILLIGSSAILAAQTPPDAATKQAVTAAAKTLLNTFWPSIESDRGLYGLSPQDNLATLTLGEPWELHGIRDSSVLAYRSGSALSEMTEPTHQWYVPLIAQGLARALIEVQEQGPGSWHGSGVGWVPLAQKWQAINRRWPSAAGSGPVLIMFFSQPGYFVTVPSEQPANLTPLSSMKLAPDGNLPAGFRLEDAARVMTRLKARITEAPRN